MNNTNIPNEYKPISAWGYFGYNILFSIPIIGFIFLIVFSFDSSNINRRNYARSFFIICSPEFGGPSLENITSPPKASISKGEYENV